MKKNLLLIFIHITYISTYAQDHYWVSFPDAVTGVINHGNHVTVPYVNMRSGDECGGSTTPYQNQFIIDTHGRVDTVVGFSGIRYANNGLFVLSDEYDISNDSAVFKDTTFMARYCDSLGNCQFVEYIVPLDFTLDADSNYHCVGYSASGSGYVVDPNKLIYYTVSGETSSNINNYYIPGPATSRIPKRMTYHKVLDNVNNFDLYCCGGGYIQANIFPTDDNQYWVACGKNHNPDHYGNATALEFLKLDQSGNITADTSLLFSDFNTDSSFAVVNYKADTFNNTIFVLADVYALRFDNTYFNEHLYAWKFDSNGNFEEEINFASIDQALSYVDARKKGYIYRSLNNDSSLVNYINTNGDTIKTVYFPTTFNQDIVKTADQRYIHFGFQFTYNSDTGILHSYLQMAVYDSSGKFMKQLVTPIYLTTYCEACPPPIDYIYSAVDQYDNIHFYTNFHDTRANHCSSYQADGGIINIGFINQAQGQVVVDSLAASGVQIELQLNGHSYFTTSDVNGYYFFAPFDTGHGIIILHLDSNPQYENTGNDTIPIILSDTVANPIVNFALRSRATSIALHSKIKTSIYPNPFNNYTTLSFDYDKSTTLSILSVEGKILQSYSSAQKNYIIYKKETANGMYLYELRDKETNGLLSNGKIIVQ